MLASTNDLVKVFEDEFGEIETGMKSTQDESIQIVKYCTGANKLKFISTLGLSNKAIALQNSPKTLRFEWYMEFAKELSSDEAASAFDYILSRYLAGKFTTPSRGSFVLFPGTKDRIWKGDNSRGLYFTLPVCRSQRFQRQMKEIGVVPVWVVPVTSFDVGILESKGWRFLEDYWDNEDIDLHSTFRN